MAWKMGIVGALFLGYFLALSGSLQGWDVEEPTKTPKRSIRMASVSRTSSSSRVRSTRRSGFFTTRTTTRRSSSSWGGGFSFGK